MTMSRRTHHRVDDDDDHEIGAHQPPVPGKGRDSTTTTTTTTSAGILTDKKKNLLPSSPQVKATKSTMQYKQNPKKMKSNTTVNPTNFNTIVAKQQTNQTLNQLPSNKASSKPLSRRRNNNQKRKLSSSSTFNDTTITNDTNNSTAKKKEKKKRESDIAAEESRKVSARERRAAALRQQQEEEDISNVMNACDSSSNEEEDRPGAIRVIPGQRNRRGSDNGGDYDDDNVGISITSPPASAGDIESLGRGGGGGSAAVPQVVAHLAPDIGEELERRLEEERRAAERVMPVARVVSSGSPVVDDEDNDENKNRQNDEFCRISMRTCPVILAMLFCIAVVVAIAVPVALSKRGDDDPTKASDVSGPSSSSVTEPPTSSGSSNAPSTSTATTLHPSSVASNDQCVTATRLEEHERVQGDTAIANKDFLNKNSCGLYSNQGGLWYEIVGTSADIQIWACSHSNSAVSFGVYSECDAESACIGFLQSEADPFSCGNRRLQDAPFLNQYSFFAEFGRSYFIHVRGDGVNNDGARFTLHYETDVEGGSLPQPFCGDAPCEVDLPNISCDRLVNDYYFTGSCCSLRTRFATRQTYETVGCRVSVFGDGDCRWTPRCGLCTPSASCNMHFTTETDLVCDSSEWDHFLIPLPKDGPNCPSSISNSTDVRVGSFPLAASSRFSCDVIIDTSTFEGSCCSVTASEGNGCVLNVVNGRCIIYGTYWNLDFTSTFQGATCPLTQFHVLSN